MAKLKNNFICQSCGAVHGKWQGKCDGCGEWNTIIEEQSSVSAAPVASGGARVGRGKAFPLEALTGQTLDAPRIPSGISELDRVTGGGFVHGSVLLLGGEPGIGKSTLLIQAAAALANKGQRVVYISGEEAAAQVRLRASRLELSTAPVELASETHVDDIVATLQSGRTPALVIIDSIQTMWTNAIESAPGTVSQVRGSAQALIRYAKSSGATVILVGHVTKDGQIAGPRVVEHMVDVVMFFEGEGGHDFRILRGLKNRFGPTDEIGVFEMRGDGLNEVANPSALFLGHRDASAAGTAVFAGMEGTRPLLIEMQALVVPTGLGTPRRAVVGWDTNRLAMILAVLEAHGGVRLGQYDVYLNVAGGLKIAEPAADVAVAAALVSSLTGNPLPLEMALFGEVSLSGAIRPVSHSGARLKEAVKLGFSSAVVPAARKGEDMNKSISLNTVERISDIVAIIAAGKPVRTVERAKGQG
jgi:DNA repair protein RadA/Sms